MDSGTNCWSKEANTQLDDFRGSRPKGNKVKIATEFRRQNPVRPNATWARQWRSSVEKRSLYRRIREIPVQPNVVLNDASKICRRNLRTRMSRSHDPEALLLQASAMH